MTKADIEKKIAELEAKQEQTKQNALAQIAFLDQQKQAVADQANVEIGKCLGRIEDLNEQLAALEKEEKAAKKGGSTMATRKANARR